MPVEVQCIECGKKHSVTPSIAKTFKFCSYACRGEWRKKNWSGPNNPKYTGGVREKTCQHCGEVFKQKQREPVVTFQAKKFCSKSCADKGGFRYEGEAHPNWKETARRKDRRGKHGSWARAVLSRDKETCQHCGVTEVEMHAHHIMSFADHPEKRWDVSNGMTLCAQCHWAVHAASNANGVNSGKLPPGQAEDNPEPSFGRKPVEGVTTSGRAYRRWTGNCEWCGTFISKRWSDAKDKKHLFCSKHCSGKFNAANREYRRWVNPEQPMAVISTTSAPRESDDIV